MKLTKLGTTGLLQYVNNGHPYLRGARLAKALKIVTARYGSQGREKFCEASSRDFKASLNKTASLPCL